MKVWQKVEFKLAMALMAVMALPAVGLLAEEAAATGEAAAATEKKTVSFFAIAKNAGFMEYILLIVSVVGMALFLQALVTIRPHLLRPPDLANDLLALCEEGNVDEALNVAQADTSFLGVLSTAALSKASFGKEAMEGALADVGELETHRYMTKISTLNLIAAIAPMLGLTGTTVGMILVFGTIGLGEGQVSPDEMAHGISVALVCTFTGLMVAIPLLAGAFYLKAKLMSTVYEVSNDVNDMIRLITSGEPKAPQA